MSPAVPATPSPAATAPGPQRPRRRWVRQRFVVLFVVALAICASLDPPAWHAALRLWLQSQAHRRGCVLSIGAIEGGLFDTTQLYRVRCRQFAGRAATGPAATEIAIDRIDFEFAWTVPWIQRAAPTWVRSVVFDGVRGHWDLRQLERSVTSSESRASEWERGAMRPAAVRGDRLVGAFLKLFPPLRNYSTRFMPAAFLVRAEDLRLERGRFALQAAGLWLSGSRDEDGQFMARQIRVAGPGFESTLDRPRGQTYWQGDRLTLSQLDLAPCVRLVSATLDGSHLDHDRLDWEGRLSALGGDVQGQGALDFSGERLGLEVAASFRGTQLAPLALVLGIDRPPDGLIDQGNLTFRGDPEHWADAQMWLAAHATDFRWEKRRWQDLELQAVVVGRRLQVHRLELRQSANRLSLTGECPLPTVPTAPGATADPRHPWREGGFSCQVDARLEDLRALADLFGPGAPEMDGRMSVNGTLRAPPGARQEIDGYLNVEGTRLILRGAPFDYLRSTLVFSHGGLRVADLQATHDRDYFTGTGGMRLDGPPCYEGQLRAEVRQLSVFTPAVAGVLPVEALASVTDLTTRLSWDDSVLRFDECAGRFGGAPFQVAGTADVRELAHPGLDLTLGAKNVPLTDGDGQPWAGADVALTLRGASGQVPTLEGEIRLLPGTLAAQLRLVPVPGASQADAPGPEAGATPPFLNPDWLPAGNLPCALDLKIVAATRPEAPAEPPVARPLPLAFWGEIVPDLRLRRHRPADPLEIDGTLTLRGCPLGTGESAEGTVYFLSALGVTPRVSCVASPLHLTMLPMAPVWYHGPADRLTMEPMAADVSQGPPGTGQEGASSARPASSTWPRAWVDDASPWADLLASPAGPAPDLRFALILR